MDDASVATTEGFIELGVMSLIAMVLSALMILTTKLPYSILKYIFGAVSPELELNRQTGLITLWRFVPILGIKRKPIIKPFSEFVPYLHQMVTPTVTGAGFSIILMHKDSRKISFGSHGLANADSRGEALAFWDFLQRYMDVDQPVPDIPLFEASRQDDPTTKKHDQAINRPPRFWRDMTNEQINKKAGDMQEYIVECMLGNDLPSYQYDYHEFDFVHVRKSKRKKKQQDDND